MFPTKETTPSVHCALLQLPDETLSEILMACEPQGALRMEQTCKILYLLSDSKRLWMTLLAKLDYDQAPDVGPHVDLGSLQAKEVKKIVVRALTSYNNWCCPDGPRITREQKVQLESHQHIVVGVLPGCQYVIAQSCNGDYFGVWDINRETLAVRYLWDGRLDRIERDCALLEGGKIARVAFCCESESNLDHLEVNFEVVHFDLYHGHATQLFSVSMNGVGSIYSLKVREDAVIMLSYTNIALLISETGKIARLTAETIGVLDVDLDIVRGTLICLATASDGTVRLFVAKLSQVFEHNQGTELLPLKDICEICRVLSFTQPRPGYGNRYTLTVCDPSAWGSARPCRILLVHIDDRRYVSYEDMMVQAHRLYLEWNHNGSDLALTYDSSSNRVLLEDLFYGPPVTTRPSIAGCWMLPSERGKCKYDIKVHRLWEDVVRISPSHDAPSARWGEVERFSGTQIWYQEGGDCILHFFD